MDFLPHFRREVLAFEAAARRVDGDAPIVPSCTGWTMSDLVAHLGWVQRYVIRIVAGRLQLPPDPTARDFLRLPENTANWPTPQSAPTPGPLPASLIDWFTRGAAELAGVFCATAKDEALWTWSQEQTAGFWLEIQTIEAALHRWDAEGAVGAPQPIEAGLARHFIPHNFTVTAPFRRAQQKAPAGEGERYRFTDGTDSWTAELKGDNVRLTDGTGDVELAGTASDLLLFLWDRIPATQLEIHGDRDVLDRYFTLVPPM
jgi:uncharacterized protein (TIGR03083 family)